MFLVMSCFLLLWFCSLPLLSPSHSRLPRVCTTSFDAPVGRDREVAHVALSLFEAFGEFVLLVEGEEVVALLLVVDGHVCRWQGWR